MEDNFGFIKLLLFFGYDNIVLIKITAAIGEHADIAKKKFDGTKNEQSDNHTGFKQTP